MAGDSRGPTGGVRPRADAPVVCRGFGGYQQYDCSGGIVLCFLELENLVPVGYPGRSATPSGSDARGGLQFLPPVSRQQTFGAKPLAASFARPRQTTAEPARVAPARRGETIAQHH